MAEFIGRSNCDHCGSKDNGAIYDDGGFHCFGCVAGANNLTVGGTTTSLGAVTYPSTTAASLKAPIVTGKQIGRAHV